MGTSKIISQLKLRSQRNYLVSKIKKLFPQIIRGTVVKTTRTCGKPNCRCQIGKKHVVYYIILQLKNKPNFFYIKKDIFKRAKQWSKNYQRAKALVDKLTLVNIKILQNINKYR